MNLKELNSFKLSDAVTFHDKLNPKLWNGTKLRPEVRDQLMVIAQDFLSELGVNDLDVKDITISGSNAAYSYTKHSDLDLHILVDMGNLSVDEVYKELFNAKKTIYNDSHDITIHTIPVELYVQDSREPVVSLGEYSVMNDNWIKIPTKRRSDFDQTATKSKYEKLLSLIEIALKSKKYSKVKHIIDTIKRYRQAGLDKGGEFGPENLAYKMLRSQGYITKLYELRDKLHSEKLSFETMYRNITDEDYDPNGPPPGPEFKPTMPAGTVKVDVSDVYDWYKLGQHISNLKGLGKHDFGQGPPSTIMAFGSEDEEHKYIDALKKTGLTTTDIDPVDPNQPKSMTRQKVDPTYNVSEEINPDVLDPRFNHKQKIGDYTYIAGLEPDGWAVEDLFVIRCYDGEKMIGQARFYTTFGDSLVSALTTVKPEYQKQGIASTMYAYARMLGNTIEPSASQLPPGKKMWKAWKKSGDAQYLMKDIDESFDQPYSLKWESSDYGDVDALARLPDGSFLSIMFNQQQDDDGEAITQVEFYRNNSQEVTGEGDAQRIFATVLTAIQKYIKKYKPLRLTFSASKLLDPSTYYDPDEPVPNPESRAKLYDRLVQRYARAWGYRAFRADNGDLVIYELSRIQKQKAVGEDYTMQFASEKTPPVSPYAGVKDNQYRGGISEASGYIPSEKEKNDPRFKTALTVDINPYTMKKGAKQFGWNISRAGIPPTAKANGKV